MTALSKSLQQQALEALTSETCLCGTRKLKQRSFCFDCYKALPRRLQNDLYKHLREGYAEAWDEARTYLKAETERIE